MITVRALFGDGACRTGRVLRADVARDRLAVKDVKLVLREILKGVLIDAEVLAEHGLGIAQEELRYQAGVAVAKVPLVEHEQEFRAVTKR